MVVPSMLRSLGLAGLGEKTLEEPDDLECNGKGVHY